jgi:hypothetical protein
MPDISNETLASISALAKRQIQAEQELACLEEQLGHKKEELQRIREELLPEAMMGVGLESFSLDDGSAIHIDKFYAAKIPDARAPEAFAWLRQNNFDAIIKREVKCVFGKGEDDRASAIVAQLQIQGCNPTDKASVHPMTLKSLVRELLEGGQDIPHDLFGVYVGNRAKVTPPKQ